MLTPIIPRPLLLPGFGPNATTRLSGGLLSRIKIFAFTVTAIHDGLSGLELRQVEINAISSGHFGHQATIAVFVLNLEANALACESLQGLTRSLSPWALGQFGGIDAIEAYFLTLIIATHR
jgi:hypothetical protein